MITTPSAVLLDVGGVFLLPSHEQIREAMSQTGHTVSDDQAIDRAHYIAVRVFPMDLSGSEPLGPYWEEYLTVYARTLDVPEDVIPEAVEHLRNAYMTGGLWSREINSAREGLDRLVEAGVPVGIVSNSDGTIERRLKAMGILQVGPGPGVEVFCVVDSGTVGVEKPDPGIFDHAFERIDVDRDGVWYVGDTPAFDVVAAQRAGLVPILMDPFGLNGDFGVTCVASLGEVAHLVDDSAREKFT